MKVSLEEKEIELILHELRSRDDFISIMVDDYQKDQDFIRKIIYKLDKRLDNKDV